MNLKKNSKRRDILVYQIFRIMFLYGAVCWSKTTSVLFVCVFVSIFLRLFQPLDVTKDSRPGMPLNLNCVKIQARFASDKKPFLTARASLSFRNLLVTTRSIQQNDVDTRVFSCYPIWRSCITNIFHPVLSTV